MAGRKLETTGRTFLLHPQLDVFGDHNGGREEFKLESAENVALVDPAVVVRDVDDAKGEVLQVLAPVPEQTALERPIHLGEVVILEPVYLRGRDGTCGNKGHKWTVAQPAPT